MYNEFLPVNKAEMNEREEQYCRVHIWIEQNGIHRNPKTILCVMQKYNMLSVIRRRRFYKYTEHLHQYKNLWGQDFKSDD